MKELAQMKCEVCRAGAPKVSDKDIAEYQKQLPNWLVAERDDVKRLERVFKFKNFAEALSFTNKIGDLAEGEGHHPAILTEWGRVGVAWWTHKIGGLHRNDFIMAARTDRVFAEFERK